MAQNPFNPFDPENQNDLVQSDLDDNDPRKFVTEWTPDQTEGVYEMLAGAALIMKNDLDAFEPVEGKTFTKEVYIEECQTRQAALVNATEEVFASLTTGQRVVASFTHIAADLEDALKMIALVTALNPEGALGLVNANKQYDDYFDIEQVTESVVKAHEIIGKAADLAQGIEQMNRLTGTPRFA